MTLRSMLSPAVEDYLKAIYKLEIEHPAEGGATTNAVARSMKVSAASVTNMLKRLSEMKLVNYESYKGVTLTEAGKKVAAVDALALKPGDPRTALRDVA